MIEWTPSKDDQKQYPHFDAPLSLKEMKEISNNPKAVEENAFLPFLKYENTYKPFRPLGKPKKIREIRFASRRDAAIFSRYRHGLSQKYENLLTKYGISKNVLAYRRVPISSAINSGKSNINHASDSFNYIKNIKNCWAISLDISNFFENLDHDKINKIWCRLLDTKILPADHYAVFQAITKYNVVDIKEAYTALGYFGIKKSGVKGYLLPRREIPKQLCTMKEFREKICGKNPKYKNLIHKNENTYGIPQGAPLSDLIANFYLLDFDFEVSKITNSLNGHYLRYSDDILIILPINTVDPINFMNKIRNLIQVHGENLDIKESKCTIDKFTRSSEGLLYEAIYPKGKSRNGLNYLGFRFDGQRVYLRDSTLSNFKRKMTLCVKREAIHLVSRYPGKDYKYLRPILKTELIVRKFGKVEDFDQFTDKKKWTFWTYIKRAEKIFGAESKIHHQVKGYPDFIRTLSDKFMIKFSL
ncbi:reverse transcriptase [Alphaproteobacteria bacterium HT1-32]|nr:reverse transcriptase [Alphaproteobacteria bacterium HT1-32]